MSDGPWTFDQAEGKARQAAANQRAARDQMARAHSDFAYAEEAYRSALNVEMVRCHNDGVAWTAAADLARGDPYVAELRRKRDIAEGVKQAAIQNTWIYAADRRDIDGFRDWSMRREMAEFHGPTPEEAIA